MAKKERKDDSNIFIGRKPSMNYVMAAMMNLGAGKPCKLLARGKSISRAVDVGEILINNFSKGTTYGEIKIGTEEMTNRDSSRSNVSFIEIELIPPK